MELNIMATQQSITLDPNVVWDSVVVGGGPAGYNAALYMYRKGLRPLLIMKDRGGQVAITNAVENYLGFESIHGTDMTEKFHAHVSGFEIDILENRKVENIEKKDGYFKLTLDMKEILKSKTMIIATGGTHRKLGIPGELEFEGKGNSYCAICDAAFFKDKDVVVVGGGDAAVEAALDLSNWATHVHLVHRSTFRAEKILLDRMMDRPNITYELGSTLQEIKGSDKVTSVLIKHHDTIVEREVQGVFIEIGQDPNSDLVKDLAELDDNRYIKVDKYGATSLEGLYAAGDVTDNPYKQIITATAEGAIAALSASNYIMKMEEK